MKHSRLTHPVLLAVCTSALLLTGCPEKVETAPIDVKASMQDTIMNALKGAGGMIALKEAGKGWLEAKITNSDVDLSGIAPNGDAAAKVMEVVKGIPGIGKITNNIVTPKMFDMVVHKIHGRMDIEGEAPQDIKDKFTALAKTLSKDVSNRMAVSKGAAAEGFVAFGEKLINGTNLMESGLVAFRNGELLVSGAVSDDMKGKIAEHFKELPEGVKMGGEMTFLDLKDVEKCDTAFTKALKSKQVLFKTGSADVSPKSKSVLKKLGKIAQKCPGVVVVEGHTDNTGDSKANHSLSEARAKAVVAALMKGGIEESKLVAHGYGEEHPVADNGTEKGRKANRRIELHVSF